MKAGRVIRVLLAVVFVILVALLAFAVRAGGATPAVSVSGGAAPGIAIDWGGSSVCYPQDMITECLRFVRKMPGFGPVSATERAKLAAKAAQLSRKHGVELRADQLVAIRHMEVGLAARRSGVLALRHGEAIAAANAAGEPVLAIAARYRLPPMAVLRQILVEAGCSPQQVRAAIAAPDTLPPKLAAEARAIFKADIGSRLNANRIRAEAQAYEDAVGAHLRVRGLVFETEKDLRKKASPGLPLLTPDFLFREPVEINGQRVRWLDAKNYVMYGSKLVAANLAKQAAKYTARLGPGAMVFSGGLMCEARVPKSEGTPPLLLLDGSHIKGL
jgi:hypothetical protein